MATTLFPHIDVGQVFIWLSVALAAGGLIVLIVLRVQAARRGRPGAPPRPAAGPDGEDDVADASARPCSSRSSGRPGLRVGILALRFYLVLSAVLLLVKAIQLGGG